jgi:ADP-ribose pyrophosphatase YjhB (NUDIX family)
MSSFAVHALLFDPNGSILLIRRRDSVLWGLPGGDVRGFDQLEEVLATLCARQTGVRPLFGGPFERFTLAGMQVAVGIDDITPGRVAARGKVQAVHWLKPSGEAPGELEPTARLAIALGKAKGPRVIQSGEALPGLVTFPNSKAPKPFWT